MKVKQFGSNVRDHLMTGVSFMIPFVVGGGVLIALSVLMGGTTVQGRIPQLLNLIGTTAFSMLPVILGGYIAYSIADRPAIAPAMVGALLGRELGAGFFGGIIAGLLAGYLVYWLKKTPVPMWLRPMMPVFFLPLLGILIVGVIIQNLVGPPAAWLNTAATHGLTNLSTGSLVVFGLAIGAMKATDLGGPLNKTAYFFAIGVGTETGNWQPMAMSSLGAMVPPLAIGIAILLARRRWTKIEREGVVGDFIGGCLQITEFAIPYAAADPFRVIPALMAGSAVAGGLSGLFGLSLPAPHGGLLMVPLTSNPLLFLFCLLAGALVGAAVLSLLKKNLPEENVAPATGQRIGGGAGTHPPDSGPNPTINKGDTKK